MVRHHLLLLLLVLLGVASCSSPSCASRVATPAAASTAASAADASSSALVFNWGQGKHAHDPVELTAANFFDLVLESRQAWVVAFVAPWCGHCRALHAPFAAASRALRSSVRFGVVDCTVHSSLAAQFSVSSYPTVWSFPSGVKSPKRMAKYEGARTREALEAHARTLLSLAHLRKASSTHKHFPRNVLSFATGSARTNFTAASLPSFWMSLHTSSPSEEQKGLSAIFDGRVQMIMLDRTDRAAQKLFRVARTPAYVLCAPAAWSRGNETGQLLCGQYDHATRGTGVPAVSEFLAQMLQDVASVPASAFTHAAPSAGGDVAAAHEVLATVTAKYGLKPAVIDSALALRNGVASSPAADEHATTLKLPPPIRAAADFHARCTDTAAGVCLLLFPTTSAKSGPLASLLSDLAAWNAEHTKRPSQTVSVVTLPASSPAAAALVDELGVLLDDSSSGVGVTLLALLTKGGRNRVVHAPPSLVGADVFDWPVAAMDWVGAVLRDAKSARGSKKPRLQERLHELLEPAAKDDAFFLATEAEQSNAVPPAVESASTDDPAAAAAVADDVFATVSGQTSPHDEL